MDPELIEIHKKLDSDFPFFASKALWIAPKEGPLAPLVLNTAQWYFHREIEDQKARIKRVRKIIVKGRQQGISTYIEGRIYRNSIRWHNRRAFILSHEAKTTDLLFTMVDKYWQNTPKAMRPPADTHNQRRFTFPAPFSSEYGVGTAGNDNVGRGGTLTDFHGCLAAGTLVREPNGNLKPIEEFRLGDLVMTHTGQYAPISYISSKVKPCFSLLLRGLRDYPLLASAEHQFFTSRGFVKTQDLVVGDRIGHPVAAITGDWKTESFGLPEAPRRQGGGSREHIPDRIDFSYDLGFVVGLYLAEGTVIRQWKTRQFSRVQFTIHRREVEGVRDRVAQVARYFAGVSIEHRPDSLTSAVVANGKSFAAWLAGFAGVKDGKALPCDWAALPEEFLRGVLHGYLFGDGHFEKATRRVSAPSIRSAISVQMRDIAASLGYGWASLAYQPPGVRRGRNEKAQYVFRLTGAGVDVLAAEMGRTTAPRLREGSYPGVEVSGGYAWVPIVAITPDEEEVVYDFEVDHPDHSYCTVHGATHNSEVAFWEGADDLEAGIMQAVSDSDNTESYLESTANGMANMFYRRAMAALQKDGVFELVFIPWYWQIEYTLPAPINGPRELDADEEQYRSMYCPAPGAPQGLTPGQMWWRRSKIKEFAISYGSQAAGERKFKQEYPAFVQEAFQVSGTSLIDADAIMKARKSNLADPKAPLVIGLDPGRTKDRSVIAYRRGRQFLEPDIYTFEKANQDNVQMVLAGRVIEKIKRLNPAKVFVDVGEGWGVVDRLRELGYGDIVTGVQFGSEPIQKDVYLNKRAEMWCMMRDWFHQQEGPVKMPDSDVIHRDLASMPDAKPTSSGRTQLETKEVIRKRFGMSPDIGDAMALTFAYPVSAHTNENRIRIATKRSESSLVSIRRLKRYNTRRER